MVQCVIAPPNPKANGNLEEPAFIPHFPAAYSVSFADWAIESLGRSFSTLVDPFAGSGTTLLAAQNKIRHVSGFELNPVWAVYSRARIVKWEEGLEAALVAELDPVLNLPEERSLDAIRRILHRGLNPQAPPQTVLAAAILLIRAREHQKPEYGLNHSWPRLNGSGDLASFQAMEVQEIISKAISHARWVSEEFRPVGDPYVANTDIRDVCALPPGRQLILTSPPYLSRLDYMKASEPEFRLLGQVGLGDGLDPLRGAQIGSVKVADLEVPQGLNLPPICEETVQMVREHPSKGSKSYYWKFVQKYLLGIRSAFRTISESARLGSHFIMVVQDSWYKEHLLPTTAMLVAMLEEFGWSAEDEWVYISGRQLSAFNPHARRWRKSHRIPERVVHMRRTTDVR